MKVEKMVHLNMSNLNKKIADKVRADLKKDGKVNKEAIFKMVKKNLDAILPEIGLAGQDLKAYLIPNDKGFEIRIDYVDLHKELQKILDKKLSMNEQVILDFRKALEDLGNTINSSIDEIESKYQPGKADYDRDAKVVAAKICDKVAIAIGAAATLTGLIALSLAIFAPPVAIAIAAGAGISGAVTIGGMSFSLLGAAAAGTAGLGTLVTALGLVFNPSYDNSKGFKAGVKSLSDNLNDIIEKSDSTVKACANYKAAAPEKSK